MMEAMHISLKRPFAVVVTATSLFVGAAACGDDDDESTVATEANAAPATDAAATTAAAAGTTAGGAAAAGDVDTFCQNELAVERAVNQEDAEAIAPAFEALSASAPDDVKASVEATISE